MRALSTETIVGCTYIDKDIIILISNVFPWNQQY